MKRKWKDTRGETFVEVLVSVLIGALSVALLFTAVTASFSMNKSAKAADEVFSESLIAAETQATEVTVPGAKVTVKGINPASSEKDVNVKFYGEKGAWSFVLTPP